MSNTVSFIFNASDRLTRPLRKMAQATEALKKRVSLLKPKLATLSKRFSAFRKELAKTGRTARGVGRDLFTTLTLPVVLAGGFMLKAASDAEETNQKFGVVFKGLDTESTKAARNLSKNFGLSKVASKSMLAATGNLLQGVNFSKKASLDMAEQVAKLGVDIQSFTNINETAAETTSRLNRALLGEREALVALDIKISEANVKRRTAILISKGQQSATLEQTKVAATLQLIMEKAKNMSGDFARSQGSLANQTRIARAKLADMSVTLGNLLVPFALKLVKLVIKLTEKFSKLSPTVKKIVVILAVVAAIIPPLLILFGTLAVVIGAVTLPITLAVLAVVALIAAGIFLIFNWDKVKKKVIEVSIAIKTAVSDFAADAAFKLGTVIGKLFDFIGVNEEIRTKIVETFNTVSSVIGSAIDLATKKIKQFIDFVTPSFKKVGDIIKGAFGGALGTTADKFTELVTPAGGPIAQPPPNATITQAFQLGFQRQRSTTDVNIKLSAPKGTVDKVDSKTRGNIDNLNLGLNMQTGTGV